MIAPSLVVCWWERALGCHCWSPGSKWGWTRNSQKMATSRPGRSWGAWLICQILLVYPNNNAQGANNAKGAQSSLGSVSILPGLTWQPAVPGNQHHGCTQLPSCCGKKYMGAVSGQVLIAERQPLNGRIRGVHLYYERYCRRVKLGDGEDTWLESLINLL